MLCQTSPKNLSDSTDRKDLLLPIRLHPIKREQDPRGLGSFKGRPTTRGGKEGQRHH